MKSDFADLYLRDLEWDGLQDEFEFTESISREHFPIIPTKIGVRRDENYRIAVNVIGKRDPEIDLNLFFDSKSGSKKLILEPFEVHGEEFTGGIKYVLSDCYLGNFRAHYVDDNEIFNINLKSFQVERTFKTDKEPAWLTEWYINSSNPFLVLPRTTQRKKSSEFIRIREINGESEKKFSGLRREEINAFDFALIKLEKYNFIIHQIPKKICPSWSPHSLGIEYRQEYGNIPEPKERESISEVVSFVFGKHLLNCGYTIFDDNGYLIKQVAINPWGNDIRSQCEKPSIPPIRLHFKDEETCIEKILPPLISQYMTVRDELKLNEVLSRYWIAEQMPLGTNIPIYANGIEILIKNWFSMAESKPRAVYISKKEFDSRMIDIIPQIEKKFSDIDIHDRIIRRINNSYNMSGNEAFDLFLTEIGLKIGKIENAAIQARNKMIHDSIEETPQNIRKMIILSRAYRTFFNRVILKILGYPGNYIDYSIIGNPLKPIHTIAGDESDCQSTFGS
jgi:hypothetical protein